MKTQIIILLSGFIILISLQYKAEENQQIRKEILQTEFLNSDVLSIEIVEIEHPMLGGIVDIIKLNEEQQAKFLSDFDRLKKKGLYKCRSSHVIRLNLKTDTLRLKSCGTLISNRNNDWYYELPGERSLISDYVGNE